MAVKTLKVYKTEKSKRSTEVTSVFKLFDDDVVNGRIRVFDTDRNIYWINVSDWVTCADTLNVSESDRVPCLDFVW